MEFSHTDQAGAGGAGVGGRGEGRARLIFFPQVATEPGAERAALAGRRHRVGAGNTGTGRTRAHHAAVLYTKTHTDTHRHKQTHAQLRDSSLQIIYQTITVSFSL